MNPATKLLAAWQAGAREEKSLSVGSPDTGLFSWFWRPDLGIDVRKVGSGTRNSAVTACFDRKTKAFAEATPAVYEKIEKVWETVEDHPIGALLDYPNPLMIGEHLWAYTIVACDAEGDAYWFKERSASGRVVELWPLLPSNVKAGSRKSQLGQDGDDPNMPITHYEYTTSGRPVRIELADIVPFRTALDPDDHRKGFAPLKTALREVMTDEEANLFTAALVKNTGIPGVVLSPDDDTSIGIGETAAEEIVETWKAKFSGARRGEPFVPFRKMKVQTVAFSPEQMQFSSVVRIPEERISAVLGVPALLAGLGAGLERATYSNARSLREFFTETTLAPLWRIYAAQLSRSLLPDFDTRVDRRIRFDTTDVRALQEDQNDLWKRVGGAVRDGFATVADARRTVGLDVDESHDVFLRGLNVVEVPVEGEPEEEPVPTADELEELIR